MNKSRNLKKCLVNLSLAQARLASTHQKVVMKEFMMQNELTPKEKIGWRKGVQFLTPNIKWSEKSVEDFPITFYDESLCTENNTKIQKISLAEDVKLDLASKDVLLRLLEIDPIRRLRSVRTLQNIAFYKDYNFEHVKEKRINGTDLLKKYNMTPSPEETFELEGF
ncbi:inner membrane transporter ygji-related [Holotrichia oblita]|uniref:Inner membrane transporter ygji-related n=1 Tax=Holotrichia oblita TaxID=644536 RepID=A0ACB9SNK6_HOLOL|nr:inner membrane transporter ygji-related [Holotrichia oblita]